MRISDWSSDVCSSDLRRHFAAGLSQARSQAALARFDVHGPRLFERLSSLYAPDGSLTEPIRCLLAGLAHAINQRPDDLFALDAARPAHRLDRADMIDIGRASCRESVVPYV